MELRDTMALIMTLDQMAGAQQRARDCMARGPLKAVKAGACPCWVTQRGGRGGGDGGPGRTRTCNNTVMSRGF